MGHFWAPFDFFEDLKYLADPVCFAKVNNGWKSLERTKTEQLDPILSLSGLHTRSHRLFWVLFVPIFVFLRTLFDPVYPYSFASVEMGESLDGIGRD